MRRLLLFLLLASAACVPDFPDDEWRITTARVLAVKSEPAEAKPGTPLRYTAFVATVDAESSPFPSWTYCLAPKPLTENNVVAADCLHEASLLPLGRGQMLASAVPSDACKRFGPDVFADGFRPRDQDPTGGYYQPVRLDLNAEPPVFHLERITCPLNGAAADTARDFGQRYVANNNPRLIAVAASSAGNTVDFSQVRAGARLTLTATWAPDDAEDYLYFDRSTQALATRREAMRVLWYASFGVLDRETSGRDEDEREANVSNGWVAPSTPGRGRLWVVLRDSRGGVDFSDYELTVVP